MKLLLTILACLVAASAGAQTIKSLGYNTTNGNIVAATNVTFTNSVGFATNARAATRTNLDLGAAWLTNTSVTNFRTAIGLGATWLTNTNVTNFRTAIGLGTTNSPVFSALTLGAGDELQINGSGIYSVGFGGQIEFETQTLDQDGFRVFAWASNSFAVTPAATFATNVSVAGSLSVGSFTTTTPSTWALDATQTSAATNGRLTLPSNANVIRLTNNNAISSVTNGVLGAFYYLVNQATNAVTLSNVGGITIDGAQNLTLSPNESATLVATGPTNVSVANRGDLTDVALGGTANTAPSQTASSGSSLMTRDLVDTRALNTAINTMPNLRYNVITASGGVVLDSPWNSGVYTAETTNAIGFGQLVIPHDSVQFGSDQVPNKCWVFTRVAIYTALNVSNSIAFGIVGTTNSTEFPVQSATSTNPAYVSYGANNPTDNRYAVQFRRNGTDLQARFIAMRQASPAGVYSETAWTNILSGFGETDLVTRPVIIALNRNGTNVSAYYSNTDALTPYEDFNSLTLLGSSTLGESTAATYGIGFRAVSISGDAVRVEFLNTTAVLIP